MKVPLPPWRLDAVSAEAMKVWAEALRDSNPIHLDAAAAERLGFGPRTVNQGPANLAYVINMLCAAKPRGTLREVEARFLGNVLAGNAVEARGVSGGGAPSRCEAVLVRSGEEDVVLEVQALFEDGDDEPT